MKYQLDITPNSGTVLNTGYFVFLLADSLQLILTSVIVSFNYNKSCLPVVYVLARN
jgi:hypothetical protein